MLCFEVLIPPTHAPLSVRWFFSYELAELILIQIRSVLKGLHQYIDSFYEGHQTAITGHQGVPFGERLPRVTDEPDGDGSSSGGRGPRSSGPVAKKRREGVLIEC